MHAHISQQQLYLLQLSPPLATKPTMSEAGEKTPVDTAAATTEVPAVETTASDDCSIKTEIAAAAAPAEKETTTTTTEEGEAVKEEAKADAFLQAILNFWAMITGKVTELDGEYKVSESLANAKGVVEAKIAELTTTTKKEGEESAEAAKEEKEWVDVKEEKVEEAEKKE